MIAALYVETGGVYYGLPDVDPWDEERDARLYAGPWPVVAHPPCAAWCRFDGLRERVHGLERGEDGGCFEAAVAAVREFGGVLEHPAHSKAWRRFGLPVPMSDGAWDSSLDDAGWSCWIDQHTYGHPISKPTWLYAHGVELRDVHSRQGLVRPALTMDWKGHAGKPHAPHEWRSKTPLTFRDALLNMARSAVRVPEGVGLPAAPGKGPPRCLTP